ncbi:DUF5666 domain-containing protein [Candidatus Kaiserbacteria bacterium]|nr:DUF5666 domain-containing protein [Candidatus Kaiserbacteria bacterium]
MNTHKYIAASGAIAFALMSATPALADSNQGTKAESGDEHGIGLHLGSVVGFLNHDFRMGGSDKEGKSYKGEERKHATSTNAVSGTVTAFNGSTITLASSNGTTYAVQITGATFNGSSDIAGFSKVQIGDHLVVKGSVNGTSVTATKVTDTTQKQREVLVQLNGIRAGVVGSVTATGFTLDKFGSGLATITTNASTTFRFGGQATTSAALTAGQLVIVKGAAAGGATDSVTASVVYIIDKGTDFIRSIFR